MERVEPMFTCSVRWDLGNSWSSLIGSFLAAVVHIDGVKNILEGLTKRVEKEI